MAAISLHHILCPTERKTPREILSRVEQWAFQPEAFEADLEVINDDSTLSLVRREPPASNLEIANGFLPSEMTFEDDERGGEITQVSGETETMRQNQVFEGET